MITRSDVVIALSNSGETAEVTALLPLLKRLGTPLISMTGRPTSTLAKHADAHLNSSVDREACPWIWPRPVRPRPRSHSAMPSPSRFWKHAASPLKTLPCHTPAAVWAGACCCACVT